MHRVWLIVLQECGVTAVAMLFASQMSISAQQEPNPPTPEFLSEVEGVQPAALPWCICKLLLV